MKKLLLILAFSIAVLLVPLQASAWWCGGSNYNDCSASYPIECCADGIPVCLTSGWDCSQRCCIPGSGCDSYDDFRFCNFGSVANCNVVSPYSYDMVCCNEARPVWNEEYQQCWGVGWQCNDNSQCDLTQGEICTENYQCEGPQAPLTFQFTRNEYYAVERQGNFYNVWQWVDDYDEWYVCSNNPEVPICDLIISDEDFHQLILEFEGWECIYASDCNSGQCIDHICESVIPPTPPDPFEGLKQILASIVSWLCYMLPDFIC